MTPNLCLFENFVSSDSMSPGHLDEGHVWGTLRINGSDEKISMNDKHNEQISDPMINLSFKFRIIRSKIIEFSQSTCHIMP